MYTGASAASLQIDSMKREARAGEEGVEVIVAATVVWGIEVAMLSPFLRLKFCSVVLWSWDDWFEV